ncbi:aminoglycoside phosphotransferase family protein [Pseudarthrobacter sp. P1]|uniref:aminoglycoside phosphotransferase family protein n=1 Tax=Pseudarthrobacter sp. P1 TaxID=3418418 RepID=UPI003CF78AD5
MPPAEVDIAEPLVQQLLDQQHPDLAHLHIVPLAHGWDNVMFRLGSHYTLRFPRRATAVPLILNEHRWLGQLARSTAVPVPAPLRYGAPSPAFQWPWSIGPWLDGVALLGIPVADRGAVAVELADFVADIHHEAPADAPRNPVRGTPLQARDRAFRDRLRLPGMPKPAAVLAFWEQSLAAEVFSGPAQWLHGDLHPGNILVHDGHLSAVVDFGDMGRGDPATDLAAAWLAFDAPARKVFMDQVTARCGTDAASWLRARGWALNMATALLAQSDNHPPLRALGEHTVAQIVSGARVP